MPAPCAHKRPWLRRLADRLLRRRTRPCACHLTQPVTVWGDGSQERPFLIDLDGDT